MNSQISRFLLMAILTVGGLFNLPIAALALSEADTPSSHALLVGITTYQTLSPLKGAVNDVETMKHVLLNRYGFAPDHIKVLTNERASRRNILSAIEQLQKSTQVNDTIYVHFSGYGSLVRTPNDESMKDTVLPYDARTDGVPDIAMSELEERLNAFKSQSIILVVDASHSSNSNCLSKLCRSAPIDTRSALYSSLKARHEMTGSENHYVLLTASNSSQRALDAPIDGRYQGLLSYAFSKILLTTNIDVSPKEVMAGIERELTRVQTQLGLTSLPEARIIAPTGRINAPLFFRNTDSGLSHTLKTTGRVASLEVRHLEEGQALFLRGEALGALPGSTWAIYPPGAIDFEPGQALTMATISTLHGFNAIARLDPMDAKVQDGSRAILVGSPPPKDLPIRLLNIAAERRVSLEHALRDRFENIQFVGKSEFARYVVDQQGDRILISAADGLNTIGLLPFKDDQALAKELALLISRSNNASGLVSLDNPTSHVKVYARVVNAQAGTSVVLAAAPRLNPDKRGNSLSARVRIYELANNRKFEQADYDSLLKDEQHALEGDVLWRKEIMLHPNSREVIQVNPEKRGHYIAIVGLFRDPQEQRWRQVIPIKDDPNQTIEIVFDDKGITGVSRDRLEPNRGVQLVAHTQAPRVRIKQDGVARSPENSLQLEVKSSCDCYITIIDVDSQGGVNLLFPTEDKNSDFYPNGMVRQNTLILLPDSLETDNKAGFHFDYSAPPGIDTIRVFASTDLDTAELLRRSAKNQTRNHSFPSIDLRNGSTNQVQTFSSFESPMLVASALEEVRSGLRARGVKTVRNGSQHQNIRPKGNNNLQPLAKTADVTVGEFLATPVSQQAPDWAATSLTIIVDP